MQRGIQIHGLVFRAPSGFHVQDMKSPFRQTFAPPLLRRNLLVAVVVGTILNLINQGDSVAAGAELDLAKIVLTYCVPFCVASYGTYNSLRMLYGTNPSS